jgi:hypothetical protein
LPEVNHPIVYDAKGRVLESGSLVERWIAGKRRGGLQGIVTAVGRQVHVDWSTRAQTSFRIYATERLSLLSRARCCPDLLLITDEEIGDGDGDNN